MCLNLDQMLTNNTWITSGKMIVNNELFKQTKIEANETIKTETCKISKYIFTVWIFIDDDGLVHFCMRLSGIVGKINISSMVIRCNFLEKHTKTQYYQTKRINVVTQEKNPDVFGWTEPLLPASICCEQSILQFEYQIHILQFIMLKSMVNLCCYDLRQDFTRYHWKVSKDIIEAFYNNNEKRLLSFCKSYGKSKYFIINLQNLNANSKILSLNVFISHLPPNTEAMKIIFECTVKTKHKTWKKQAKTMTLDYNNLKSSLKINNSQNILADAYTHGNLLICCNLKLCTIVPCPAEKKGNKQEKKKINTKKKRRGKNKRGK
eukprot:139474_1